VTWPTEIEQSQESYETGNGNTATVETTVWPAAPIVLVAPDPEPPVGI
jgi:hypothetical protein